MGHAPLDATTLSWELKKPCNDCPFRRDAPDHEGVCAEIPNIVESIKAGTFAHTCHKTDVRPTCDGPRTYDGPTEHCAGGLHFVIRAKRDLQLPLLLAMEDGRLDIHEAAARAEKDETVFATLFELVRYYCAMGLRLIDRKEEAERATRVRPKSKRRR